MRRRRSSCWPASPVHVVSQRLGHASPMITLGVYAHVLPGSQRDASDLFARLIAEAAS